MPFTIKTKPTGFKSRALPKTLFNLKKLPQKLEGIGSIINKRIKINLSGRLLKKRSGDLHDSWTFDVKANAHGYRLTIGSDIAYAAIHNFGGFSGRNHATKIKKTRYVDKAVIQTKLKVRALLRDYLVKIFR